MNSVIEFDNGPTDLWYFAYGSSLLTERQEKRTHQTHEWHLARLPDFRLRFNKRSLDGTQDDWFCHQGNRLDPAPPRSICWPRWRPLLLFSTPRIWGNQLSTLDPKFRPELIVIDGAHYAIQGVVDRQLKANYNQNQISVLGLSGTPKKRPG